MANVRQEPTTGTTDRPQVDVYDNDKTGTASTSDITGTTTRTTTPTTSSSFNERSDLATSQPSTNWGAIILGILVVLALIALLMWLF